MPSFWRAWAIRTNLLSHRGVAHRYTRGSAIRKLLDANQLERSTHVGIRAASRKFGSQRPKIGAVFLVKGIDAETVLLSMVIAAEADPEDVVGLLADTGVGRRAKVGEVNAHTTASRDATAMRPHPAAMPRPDFLHWQLHTELRAP